VPAAPAVDFLKRPCAAIDSTLDDDFGFHRHDIVPPVTPPMFEQK
jgi:hypothetical protein